LLPHASLLETNSKREYFRSHGVHWNFLGKTSVVKLVLQQINKLIGKVFETPINLVWKDNALVGYIGSYNKEMTILFRNVDVNSENIRDNEQRKQQQATVIDEINLHITSVRQRKIRVTRREDFLRYTPHLM
jgi:hypothetical protein